MNELNVQRNYKDTVFRMLFREKENLLSLYNALSKTLVQIPSPRFVVFYNGADFQPEHQILRLSDSFEKRQDQPELELTVSVYNINLGHNEELLNACSLLKEYAQYVEQVRIFAQKYTSFPEAVEKAVNYCIENHILANFLSKNRAEVIDVSIFEYDEEKHIKSEREEWRNIGREEKLVEQIRKKRAKGKNPEAIADELEEDIKTILNLLKQHNIE